MKKLSIALMFLTVLTSIFALSVNHNMQFSQLKTIDNQGFTQLILDGGNEFGEKGSPKLPTYGVSVLVPYGYKLANIDIKGTKHQQVLKNKIYPIQQKYPLSKIKQIQPKFTQPNNNVYNQGVYPTNMALNKNEAYFRGYKIASFVVMPFQYYPKNDVLDYYSNLDLTINFERETENTFDSKMLKSDEETLASLQKMVINPDASFSYPRNSQTRNNGYELLIIAPQMLENEFNLLAEYKNSIGVKTKIVTTEYIDQTFDDEDMQGKIRVAILTEYLLYNIKHVLLAGDTEIIPVRGLAIFNGNGPDDHTDLNMASDLYYTNLDGTFNDDNDDRWGEWGEYDTISEISSGRASVSNSTEASNFVHKQIMYQQNPVANELDNYMLVGEDLGWQKWGKDYMLEIDNGSSANGYTTAGIPNHLNVDTLYDLEGTWNVNTLFNKLNSGKNLVGHLGHALNNYVAKMYNSDVNSSNFTNNGGNHNFYIFYTQGCYCNAFDNRGTDFNPVSYDAISEKMTNFENGPVAFIGNTRYGLGDGIGTNGPSQRLMREFYDAIFAEDITEIGAAHVDSRHDIVPFLSANSGLLWVSFVATLLGDPTLDIYTNTPQNLNIDFPAAIAQGTDTVEFNATINNLPAKNIRVCILKNNEPIAIAKTNANGVATAVFATPPSELGELNVKVSGHNILDYNTSINVTASDQAYVVPTEYKFGDSNENLLNWNDTTNLKVEIKNIGQQNTANITALLSCESPYIEIIQNQISYTEANVNQTVLPTDGFIIKTKRNVPNNTNIEFNLLMFDGNSDWNYTFTKKVSKPNFGAENVGFTEISGNNNGHIDAGEEFSIATKLTTGYEGTLENVVINASCENSNINLTNNNLTLTNVASDALIDLSSLTGTVNQNMQALENAVIYITINSDRGYSQSFIHNLTIKAYEETFEENALGWVHQSLNSTADQWHISTADNHTPGGSKSFLCGTTNDYRNNSYNILTSPFIDVPNGGAIAFWHHIDAEVDSQTPGRAYDGGYVQASTDGINFVQITSTTGYTHTATGNPNNGLPANTPMYSGSTPGWEQEVFTLTELGNNFDQIMLRFVFSSDSYVTDNGWKIDDVKVINNASAVTPTNIVAENVFEGIKLSWDTPEGIVDYYKIKKNNVVCAERVMLNSFVDENVNHNSSYTYKIAAVVNGNVSAYSDAISAQFVNANSNNAVSNKSHLQNNYPNPFNPTTKINYYISPDDAKHSVSLKVYNVKGQLVKTLVSQKTKAGINHITWHGKNTNNQSVASGMYFYRLQTKSKTQIKKMLLLK